MVAPFCSRWYKNLERKVTFLNEKNVLNTVQIIRRINFDVSKDVFKTRSSEFRGEKNETFLNKDVQNILKKMTGFDTSIIFKARKEDLQFPIYKVLTAEELKLEEERSMIEGEKRLQMPVIMSKRKPINVMVLNDPEIVDVDEDGANFVFTDISPLKDKETRSVLVRENATGILREALWDERDRMEFIYWPKEGQHHEILPMLQDEYLSHVLREDRHEDALDIINLQCSPDAPDYIRVHHFVYDDINENMKYNNLYSTRHFGGMVFYLVSNNNFHSLLHYLIVKERLSDAVDLLRLHSIVNKDSKLASDIEKKEHSELLQFYAEEHYLSDIITWFKDNASKTAESINMLLDQFIVERLVHSIRSISESVLLQHIDRFTENLNNNISEEIINTCKENAKALLLYSSNLLEQYLHNAIKMPECINAGCEVCNEVSKERYDEMLDECEQKQKLCRKLKLKLREIEHIKEQYRLLIDKMETGKSIQSDC